MADKEAAVEVFSTTTSGGSPVNKKTRVGSSPSFIRKMATIPAPLFESDDEATPISNLPDPKESKAEPDEFLRLLVKAQLGVELKVRKGLDLASEGGYFPDITEEQQAAYTMEVLTPARDNNVDALKALVEAKGRQAVDCCNRFGETLLNLACRRGFTEVAEFLLSKEIGLDVRMKDDFGRTPLHDACWHPKPQLDICGWLIERDPTLLLVSDKRGNTPFQYAREEDWPTWRQFLFDHRASLQQLTEPATLKRFSP